MHPMRALFLMAFLFGASSALADPSPRPIPWVTITEWHVSTLQVRVWGPGTLEDPQPWTGLYFRGNVSDPYPSPQLSAGTWYTVDLAPFGVEEDAKAAFLSGILIITRGTAVETADVHVTMARADDTTADCSKYIGQTIEATAGGGQRSNMATFVPLSQAKFKFCFYLNTPGQWPDNSSYGINLTLQAWGR